MRILQSSLAVTKHQVRKVRFSRRQFRGRWEDCSEIYEITEEHPAAYIMNGQMIVHPALYSQVRAAQNAEILNRPTFDFSMPAYKPPDRPRENLHRYHDYALRGFVGPSIFSTITAA